MRPTMKCKYMCVTMQIRVCWDMYGHVHIHVRTCANTLACALASMHACTHACEQACTHTGGGTQYQGGVQWLWPQSLIPRSGSSLNRAIATQPCTHCLTRMRTHTGSGVCHGYPIITWTHPRLFVTRAQRHQEEQDKAREAIRKETAMREAALEVRIIIRWHGTAFLCPIREMPS